MDFITSLVLIVNVISALAVIVLVLMQHGKGADMGAAFGSGSGSAGSVFGASGSANFLSRSTGVLATVFFVTCMGLVLLTAPKTNKNDLGVMSGVAASAPAAASVPAGQKIPD